MITDESLCSNSRVSRDRYIAKRAARVTSAAVPTVWLQYYYYYCGYFVAA